MPGTEAIIRRSVITSAGTPVVVGFLGESRRTCEIQIQVPFGRTSVRSERLDAKTTPSPQGAVRHPHQGSFRSVSLRSRAGSTGVRLLLNTSVLDVAV